MSNLSVDHFQNLKNLNVRHTLSKIAATAIDSMYSSETKRDDYLELFHQYFDKIFVTELEHFFYPILRYAIKPDAELFFIKADLYLKNHVSPDFLIFGSLWTDIQSEVLSQFDTFSLEYNHDFVSAIESFHFDYTSDYGNLITNFFNEMRENYNNGLINESNPEISEFKKLKVNLSVPELALLFKALKEQIPGVFFDQPDTEIIDFISKSFQSKKSDNISKSKLSNCFYTYEAKAKENWIKYFSKLQAYVNKL